MLRKLFKRFLSFTLIISLLCGSLLSSFGSVVLAEDGSTISAERTTTSDGTANGRVNVYINAAAGKTIDPATLKNLNTTQLRFLGVMMSNFYTPWMTDLGSSSDKTSQTAQDNMTSALQEYIGFDEVTARTFSEYLQGIQRASAQELKIKYKGSTTDKTFNDAKGEIAGRSITYADLLLLASGRVYELKNSNNQGDKPISAYVGDGYGDGDYRYAYLGFDEGGSFKPVFSFDTRNEKNTPSTVAFLKAMEMVDVERGYGYAMLDFKDGEIELSKESFQKLMETTGEDKLSQSSIYGAKLAVTAFNDIVWMGANHQYVILPGAMNPFTWQRIDGSGKDYGQAGNALNIANAQLMAHITNNSLGGISTGKDAGTYKLTPQNNEVIAKNSTLRLVVGSSQTSVEGFADSVAGAFFNNSTPQDMLQRVVKDPFIKERGLDKATGLWSQLSLASDQEQTLSMPSYSSSTINVMGGMALLDDQGGWSWSSDTGDASTDSYGKTDDTNGAYNLIQKASIINQEGTGFADIGQSSTSSFTWGNSYKETKDQGYAKLDSSATAKTTWRYLYTTYAVAALAGGKFAGGDNLGYRMNSDNMAKITGESIKLSASDQNDQVTKSIRDWLYYLLHPTDGFTYFVTWITNKLNAFLLGWHNDMSGTEGVGVLPGTTRYIGFSGYVTTPELSDMEWTDAMVNWYKSIIIYLIIGFFIIFSAYVIIGMLTFQKAVLGLVLFSILVYAPIVVVTNSVNLSNRFANFVFGDKFAYWGIIQQQAYFADLADSIDSSSTTYQNYLLSRYRENATESGNQGGDNIVLRWQAPKKMANLVLSNNEERFYSDDFLDVIKVATSGNSSAESFTSNTASTYMYRSYTDLANVSMFMYGDFVSNGSARDGVGIGTSSSNTSKWSSGLKESWANFGVTYSDDRANGYSVPDSNGSGDGNKAFRIRLPLSGTVYSDAADVSKIGTISNLRLGQYVGLDQRYFDFSLAQLNTNQDLIPELSSDSFDASAGGKYTNEDIKSLAAYGIMSENPFYYFSWDLYDQGLASNPNAKEGFRDLLLSKSDSGYFYNTENNNELRDYLDMRSMFTYLIPYLKQGNDLVREWDETYGVFFYDGVTYEEGHENDPDISSNPELAQKYWHNVNVARLYNIYTPWVDLMYDTSYAKSEKISYQGETYVVSDPINPASYPKERPMVFSESEMYDYGITEDQLTQVERKIMAVSKKTMARWFDLLNYYNFTDVALNTSAAMEATFIFNQEFSQTKLTGSSVNIYPQSFELKNFTYDAFLRMIIANSTGESLISDEGSNGSIYQRVMQNSSLTTGILLIVLDVLAIYAIPLLKMILIIATFISIVLLVIISALSVSDDIGKKTLAKVAKALLVPSAGFLGVSIAMSWVVSLFMGRGNTSVTGSTGSSIVLGDPAMTILAMVVLNIVVFIAYWRVLQSVWSGLKKYGGMVFSHIGGVLAGAALMGAAALGIGGRLLKGSTDAVVGTTKSVANATVNTAKAVDNSVGITNKGSQRARERAEQKAMLRQSKKDFREAKRETRGQRYGSLEGFLNRHSILSQQTRVQERDSYRRARDEERRVSRIRKQRNNDTR